MGSNDRNDQVLTAAAGTPGFYADAAATRSDANDYTDGNGNEVHSAYPAGAPTWRWAGRPTATPDRASLAKSDGEAAYADRSMDGVKFDRENVGPKFEKRDHAAAGEAEAQVFITTTSTT